MKRILCLMLILLAAAGCRPAFAENAPLIFDDEQLLTESERTSLYEVMQPLCEFGVPMFWTTSERGAYETLAENFYHSKIGRGSGILFVINMYARQLTVYTDGEIYQVITPSEAETLTDNVFRAARAGRYYDCAASIFEQAGRLLRGQRIARPMKTVSNVLLAATLALLIISLYVGYRYEQNKASGKVRTSVPLTVASGAAFSAAMLRTNAVLTKRVKTDLSSGSGGGHGGHGGGGGGFSGGGGGGGHSGGGGSHGF